MRYYYVYAFNSVKVYVVSFLFLFSYPAIHSSAHSTTLHIDLTVEEHLQILGETRGGM